jgi:hypothetical protein
MTAAPHRLAPAAILLATLLGAGGGIVPAPARAATSAQVAALQLAAAQAETAQTAGEKPIVADLSKHLVAITTGFAGTDVLLFGATDGPGDVVLVVRGPAGEVTVRRKGRIGAIWVNEAAATVLNAPAFYYVGANRPVEALLSPAALDRHQILARHLDLRLTGIDESRDGADDEGGATPGTGPETGPGPGPGPGPGEDTRQAFRDALERLKHAQGLYGYDDGGVTLLGNRLFRAELAFPANVPTGTYRVEVYLVRDGDVVSAEITPLVISKVGIGADVFHFAHNQSALYGLAAIVVAVFAGWLAGVAFRKG